MKFISKIFLFVFLMIASKNILGQVVLNELKIRPRGATNTPPNGLNLTGSEEYIELYNQGCTPLNVAGYYIAMRQDFNNRISGGTIRIPNIPQAVIPPKSHIVIAPATAAPASDIDIVITVANVPYCTYNSSFVLPNVDGWAALYDASGTPVDAVYWTSAASNINTQIGRAHV